MKIFLSLILCFGLAVGVLIACGSDDDDGGGGGGLNTCRELCEKGVGCGFMDSGNVEICTTVCRNVPESAAKTCGLDCPLTLDCYDYESCLNYCKIDLG